MYYNKRLHPRQPESHQEGCILHELDEQRMMTRHSSQSSLDHHHHHHLPATSRPRRRLTSTGSTCSGSTTNLSTTYAPTVQRRDYIASPSVSLSAMQNTHYHPLTTYRRPSSVMYDDTTSTTRLSPSISQSSSNLLLRSPSVPDSDSSTTSILSTHASDARKSIDSPHSLKNVSFSSDFVDGRSSSGSATARRRYDSPAEIIAALFPESVKETPRRKSSLASGGGGAVSAAGPSTVPPRKASVTPNSAKVGRPLSAAVVSNPPWLGAGSSGVVARRASTSSSIVTTASRSAANRAIYRPDSLQTLDRDFDGMKYEMELGD